MRLQVFPIHLSKFEKTRLSAIFRKKRLYIMKCAFCLFCGILTLFAGCNSKVKSQLSAWQTIGNNVEFSVSCREFQKIAADEILPVPNAMRKKCIALLENQEFCAPDVEMLNELNCQFPPQQTFLVRAVSYGEKPEWKVFFDPSTKICYIYSATWSGETFLSFTPPLLQSPLCVRLPEKPSRIFSAAQIGGDGVGMQP